MAGERSLEAEAQRLASAETGEQHAFVRASVLADPVAVQVLERASRLGVGAWALAAGAVYQNVWNALTGRPGGYGVRDYDLAYCNVSDLSWDGEDVVIRRAEALFRDLSKPVEVRNQARVHLWFQARYGTPRTAITSIEEALLGYAAPAHMVAIAAGRQGGLGVIAPKGLQDVFAMVIRPERPEAYTPDLIAKVRRMQALWPNLRFETGL